jgi:hypothetical protein
VFVIFFINNAHGTPYDTLAQSGSTAVAAWVASKPDGGASCVYASCLGDSKCLLFDNYNGMCCMVKCGVYCCMCLVCG